MKDFPIIKFTIAFVIGILFQHLIKISIIVVLALIILLILFLLLINLKRIPRIKFIGNFISFLLIISLGNITSQLNQAKLNPVISSLYKENNVTASGVVSKIELIRENELVFNLKADKFNFNKNVIKDEIRLLCKFRGTWKDRKKLYKVIKPGFNLVVTGFYAKGKEKRNPGEFDYNAYLNSKGIVGQITINEFDDIKIISSNYNFFKNLIFQSRKYVDKQINRLYDKNTAGLLRGLLLADRSKIDYDTKTQFINSGVIHVLAVSGLHVGFIAVIFFILLGRFNIYLRSLATIFGLVAFMVLTGIPPSVFRATVMAVVIIIAFLSNRSTNIFNSLAIAALIILVITPNEIYSPGFQLSFSAVLAIGIIYPIINNYVSTLQLKSKILRYIILFIAVSFAAQLGTLPFTLIYFGKISVIALSTNLLVIPVIGVIIALAVTSLVFNVFVSGIAVYFALTNMLISNFVLDVIKFTGSMSFSHVNLPEYSTFDALVFYIFLSILIFSVKKFQSRIAIILLILITTINIFLFSSIDKKDLLPDNKLSIMAIDVGQGDAILIKFPDNHTALIDAGQATYYFDNGERVIIPLLDYLGIDKIDYGFISHMDLDHYGGFVSLILNRRVKRIFKPKIDLSLQKDIKFEKFLRGNNIEYTYYDHQSLSVGNYRIFILNDKEDANVYNLAINNNSGLIKIVYGFTAFLFPGDAEKKEEEIIINDYNKFLNVDVLKVGHHGSKTSTSEDFIKFTTPKYAIISAGINNKFGHPDPDIIIRLKEHNIKVFRTDKSGAIILTSDGGSIKHENWKD